LRQRAGRPQLKRDPLDGGNIDSMNLSGIWQRLTRFERRFLCAAWLWAGLLFVGTALGVELESWKAQKVVTLLFWLGPLALVVLALEVRRSPWRRLAIIATTLLTVASVLPAGCAGLEVAFMPGGQNDPGFEPVLRQRNGTSDLVLYRTNCGATCSFGLVLRQQRRIVPGLRIARRLADWYPADSATLLPLSPELIRVQVAPYGNRRPDPIVEDVHLRASPLWP